MDSLDMVELMSDMEDRYNINSDDFEAKPETVGELAKMIEKLKGGRRMTHNETEIIDALTIIKEVCKENEYCSQCPLRANDADEDKTYCAIESFMPKDLKIATKQDRARRLIN